MAFIFPLLKKVQIELKKIRDWTDDTNKNNQNHPTGIRWPIFPEKWAEEAVMEILGIDIGFGFTKATNGTDTIIFNPCWANPPTFSTGRTSATIARPTIFKLPSTASPISSGTWPNSSPGRPNSR